MPFMRWTPNKFLERLPKLLGNYRIEHSGGTYKILKVTAEEDNVQVEVARLHIPVYFFAFAYSPAPMKCSEM
jgi:hypothetical protein